MDLATVSALVAAGGTLVLAGATFASVRSANRAARVAERSLLAGLRPLLNASRVDDRRQKVVFRDERWFEVPGGGAIAEADDEAVYLIISVRNAGTGLAVLHGWHFEPENAWTEDHASLNTFTRLTRDLYIPPGDIGFWQGTFRDPTTSQYRDARRAIESQATMTVDVLYGDFEGGQRSISRFAIWPHEEGRWLATVGRHWVLDRVDPRDDKPPIPSSLRSRLTPS